MLTTMNQLAETVTKLEGKKKSLPIGQVKEILGIVADISFTDPSLAALLYKCGARRAKAKRK